MADVASSQPEGPSRLIARTDPLVPQGSVAESGNECGKEPSHFDSIQTGLAIRDLKIPNVVAIIDITQLA